MLQRSLVTATKTRKKQQTEAIKKALQQRDDKKKAERESFLITTIPITRQAAREPALDHVADDHVEREYFFSNYTMVLLKCLIRIVIWRWIIINIRLSLNYINF